MIFSDKYNGIIRMFSDMDEGFKKDFEDVVRKTPNRIIKMTKSLKTFDEDTRIGNFQLSVYTKNNSESIEFNCELHDESIMLNLNDVNIDNLKTMKIVNKIEDLYDFPILKIGKLNCSNYYNKETIEYEFDMIRVGVEKFALIMEASFDSNISDEFTRKVSKQYTLKELADLMKAASFKR